MAVSNSCGTGILKFDDVMGGILLSEEARRKSSGSAETLGSALSVDQSGRSGNKEKKKNGRLKFKLEKHTFKPRDARCWRCGEMEYIQKDYKQMKDGEGKGKKKDSAYITESDVSDVLILSLAESSESWVIDSDASFNATSRQDIFPNNMKSGLGKVYLGDDEPCDIVGKSNVVVSLSNGSTLKLRNVRHVPKLKRNLISIRQLASGEMKTTFDSDV